MPAPPLRESRTKRSEPRCSPVRTPPAAPAMESAGVVTAWERLYRTCANPKCPCLRSDPKFPHCLPFLRDLLVGIGIDDGAKASGVTNPINADAPKSHHQEYRRGNHRS
jgi:hypothetical protein